MHCTESHSTEWEAWARFMPEALGRARGIAMRTHMDGRWRLRYAPDDASRYAEKYPWVLEWHPFCGVRAEEVGDGRTGQRSVPLGGVRQDPE